MGTEVGQRRSKGDLCIQPCIQSSLIKKQQEILQLCGFANELF